MELKEMLARAIHEESPGNRAFVGVAVALPETLIESELFRHEGSFTSATQTARRTNWLTGNIVSGRDQRPKRHDQAKLLRVLEQGEVERIGGDKPVKVNVRVVVATHRKLEEQVKLGHFRQDLFHRIFVFPIVLPPLRERPEDIPALAAHFAAKAAQKYGHSTPELEPVLIDVLQDYAWPGNVRELENLLERLIVLSNGSRLGIEFVPEKMLRTLPDVNTSDESTLEGAVSVKRRMILNALQHEGEIK